MAMVSSPSTTRLYNRRRVVETSLYHIQHNCPQRAEASVATPALLAEPINYATSLEAHS